MNTYSVDLSMDLVTLATLATNNGLTVQAILWEAPRGGHCVKGTLVFPASVDSKSLNHFQAVSDFNSLFPRDTYTLIIKGSNGLDRIEIAPTSTFTFTVEYAGAISDITPPPVPLVMVIAAATADTLSASWTVGDPDCAITLYRYAIGSTPGSADIVYWSNTTSLSFLRSGLGLIQDMASYISVMARNADGLWGLVSISPPVIAGSGQCTTNVNKVFMPMLRR